MIASDLDAVALRDNPVVTSEDTLLPVPSGGERVYILWRERVPTYRRPYTDPFGTGSKPPYLALRVSGPSGASGVIVGVVDSGADSTCLPFSYASLMGYQAGDLERRQGVGAGGAMDIWAAKTPATAVVEGLTERTFAIWPLFLPNSSHALWGRADFFREFGIAFDEPGQAFMLTTVDP